MKLICTERNPEMFDRTEPNIQSVVLIPAKEKDGALVPMEWKDEPPFNRMVLQGVRSSEAPKVGDILDFETLPQTPTPVAPTPESA